MNLSTARASRRLKEVGIKKVLGSSRKTLIVQFISEAVFMSFLSLILAGFIVGLFMPVFNQITGKEIAVQLNLNLILIIASVTFLTGILSGSYPAFYLSSFNPVAVLKGKIKNSVGEIIARKGLVVFQFVVSLVLIVSVMVIYKQVYFIQSKNLGYNKDNIIYFDKEGTIAQNSDAFLAELKKNPNILNISAIQQNVVQNGHNNSTYGIDWPGKTKNELVNFVVRNVDYDLIETLGIQIKEGRSFSKQFGSDSSKLIFNETAIKIMGLKDPIGTKLRMWDEDVQIVGVVKDFHISSLHEPILPMVFRYNHDKASMIMAKIKAGKERETIADLEKFYKKYNPGYLFDYKFLDNTFQAQYVSEQRVSTLSKYFAVLTILISCLGLFGLAAFNAESKTKEIGIRKVLGATASSVMYLLSKDFFKLIIIAALIAFPLAWWAMNNWLSDFAYKIKIGSDVFFIAFAAMVMLTFLTISYQAIKAAIANPIKSLRTE
jgi:ABC-type antimicrobial peptide transport system permease subunit